MKLAKADIYSLASSIPALKFEEQQLTSFAGLIVFQKLFERCRLRERLHGACAHLQPRQQPGFQEKFRLEEKIWTLGDGATSSLGGKHQSPRSSRSPGLSGVDITERTGRREKRDFDTRTNARIVSPIIRMSVKPPKLVSAFVFTRALRRGQL